MDIERKTAMVVSPRNELTLASPELIQGAKALKYKPQTLLARIQQFLPNPVEARIYLSIGPQLKHRPATFAIILRELMGSQEINEHDLDPVKGSNTARVEWLLDALETILTLTLRVPDDYNGLRLGAQTAARLWIAYGHNADTFIASVMDNIPEVAQALGYTGRKPYRSRLGDDDYEWYPEGRVAKHAFGMFNHVIYPYCRDKGVPYFLEFLEFFQVGEIARSVEEWDDMEDE
jgi:hypothetical protein